MSEVPVQVVVAAWNDERAAGEALGLIKDARRAQLIGIMDAAVLRRDAKGKLHIKDVGEIRQRRRSVVGGGVIGAIVGVLAGPLVIPTVAGALIGGLAAKLRDTGFSDPQLDAIGSALKPGSSAIVAVIEHRWVEELERQLAQAGADTVVEALRADIAAQLEAGHDVAYTALETTGALAAGRIAGSGGEIVVDGVVSTEDATYLGSASATAATTQATSEKLQQPS